MNYQRLIFYLGLYFVVYSADSQSLAGADRRYTDSIEALITGETQDTSRALLLNKLSAYWSIKDSGRAAGYARRALKFTEGKRYYRALSVFNLGGAYFYFEPEKGEKEYLRVINILKKDSSKKALSLMGLAWQNYGSLLQRQGNDKANMRILLEHGVDLAQRAGDTLGVATCYSSVALIFRNLLDYDKASHYYQKAIRLAKSVRPLPSELGSMYVNYAQNFLYNNQNREAKLYLDSALTILSKLPTTDDHVNFYMALGTYYSNIHKWQLALVQLNKAASVAENLYPGELIPAIRYQTYKAYDSAKLYSKAKDILISLYRDTAAFSDISDRMMLLYNLAEIDAKMKNTEGAYNWLLKYTDAVDSFNEKKLFSEISEMEIKYESEKKQRKILALQNENKRQQLVMQKNSFINYLLLTGVIIFFLVSVIVFIFYKNKRRREAQQNDLLQQQIRQIAQNEQLKIYNAMIDGQERERRRIALDLHDGLGGMLAGVKLKLSDIAENNYPDGDHELDQAMQQLDNSVDELRHIAHNMMPETLIRFGVENAMRDLCDSLKTPSLNIDFQSYQLSENLTHTVQITIYRIVQELLANAVKHAHASNILVQCSQNEDRIFITVEDDGQGFDTGVLKYTHGIGIANIRNRINYLDGKLDIQSTPGEGTVVNLEVNTHE